MTTYLTKSQRLALYAHWLEITPPSSVRMEWRRIPSFEQYEVSEWGHVRRRGRGPLTPTINNTGRLSYQLYVGSKRTAHYAHRLTLLAFFGPPPSEKHECAHRDDDGVNNHFTNLRWATREGNEADKKANGRTTQGERSASAVLTRKEILEIRQSEKKDFRSS